MSYAPGRRFRRHGPEPGRPTDPVDRVLYDTIERAGLYVDGRLVMNRPADLSTGLMNRLIPRHERANRPL